MGVAHHGQKSIFRSMLILGRTAGRTIAQNFGCRLSSVHRHPEPLSQSEDAIDRFRVDSQDRGCSRSRPEMLSWPSGARWDGMSGSTDHPPEG
jgi:hypothetical protein